MFRLLILAALVLGGGAGLAAADVAGVPIPQLGINVPVPPEKASPLERLVSVATTDSNMQSARPPEFEPEPIPGQLLDPDVPVPVAPSILRERNGWLVSDGKTLVAVYAGTAGDDSAVGRIVIVRQDLVAGTQTVRIVDAGRTGALTIADAPLGSAAETSVQTGDIGLRTASGGSLTLDLGTDTVGG